MSDVLEDVFRVPKTENKMKNVMFVDLPIGHSSPFSKVSVFSTYFPVELSSVG